MCLEHQIKLEWFLKDQVTLKNNILQYYCSLSSVHSTLGKLRPFGNAPWVCRLSKALIESRQFIGWWCGRSYVTCSLKISLPSRSGHINSSPFGDCSSGTPFSSQWSAMEYRRCQPPCSRFIASDDPHSKCVKCMGFSHACEAVYGISKCQFCENFHLKTLCTRLAVFERESSAFPHRALEATGAFREFTTWGSDMELEAMESEQTWLAFSLPLSPEHVRVARLRIIHSSIQLWGFRACFSRCSPA